MTLEQACPSECQWAQCAFKDSMTHGNSAIRITYRISLRSSSMPEPRDPLLKVLFLIENPIQTTRLGTKSLWRPSAGTLQPEDWGFTTSGSRPAHRSNGGS